MELLRSWHAINAPDGCSSLTSANYNVSDTAYQSGVIKGQTTAITSGVIAAADWLPGYAYAQELEIYSQKSGVLCQGLNSLGQQIFFECSSSVANATDSYILDFYAWYDHIMLISPDTGIISARF